MITDRGERLDVRHPFHLQRVVGLPCVLAHLLHHGGPVLWRKVLQMLERGQSEAARYRGQGQVGVRGQELLLGQLQDHF